MMYILDVGDCKKHVNWNCIEFRKKRKDEKIISLPRCFMVDYDEYGYIVSIHVPRGMRSSSSECLRIIKKMIVKEIIKKLR